jgi:hypothetical protein
MKNKIGILLCLLFAVSWVGVGCSGSQEESGTAQTTDINAGAAQPTGGESPNDPASPPTTTPPDASPPVVTTTPPGPVITLPPNPPVVLPGGPPPAPTCPGKLDENFPLSDLRIYFYTGRKSNAGTNQPVFVSPIGGSGAAVNLTAISYEYSKLKGVTDPGSVDKADFSYESEQPYTSQDFLKMKISLGSLLSGEHPWFLGGLVVEGLKKGCSPSKATDWTPLYVNPFVRTWIDTAHPLIVTQDDAVAVFKIAVGTKDDASSDGDFYGGTPFENRDPQLMKKTPMLDYPDTDDFQAGRTYYYGRSYFAAPQSGTTDDNSRLIGKFSDLSSNIHPAFDLYLVGDDGTYLDHAQAFLVQPQYKNDSTHSFWGYGAYRDAFWIDADCGFLTACAASDLEFLFTDQSAREIQNLGETPADTSPLGYLNWAIQYDNPGDHVVTGGI